MRSLINQTNTASSSCHSWHDSMHAPDVHIKMRLTQPATRHTAPASQRRAYAKCVLKEQRVCVGGGGKQRSLVQPGRSPHRSACHVGRRCVADCIAQADTLRLTLRWNWTLQLLYTLCIFSVHRIMHMQDHQLMHSLASAIWHSAWMPSLTGRTKEQAMKQKRKETKAQGGPMHMLQRHVQ